MSQIKRISFLKESITFQVKPPLALKASKSSNFILKGNLLSTDSKVLEMMMSSTLSKAQGIESLMINLIRANSERHFSILIIRITKEISYFPETVLILGQSLLWEMVSKHLKPSIMFQDHNRFRTLLIKISQ